jgi:hypothetical protein
MSDFERKLAEVRAHARVDGLTNAESFDAAVDVCMAEIAVLKAQRDKWKWLALGYPVPKGLLADARAYMAAQPKAEPVTEGPGIDLAEARRLVGEINAGLKRLRCGE